MYKSLLIRSKMIGFLSLMVLCAITPSQIIIAESKIDSCLVKKITSGSYLPISGINKYSYQVVRTMKVIVTAYSSTPDQTDDTPFITASGKPVAHNIIAINGLAFDTKVRIPGLYGDKIFIVGDRMHPRMGKYHADIWFPDRQQAKEFGAKYDVAIEILEG